MTSAQEQIVHHGESKVWWIEHWTMSPKDLATVPGSTTDSFRDLEEVMQHFCAFKFFFPKNMIFLLF